jgi:hypothetical protein
LPHGESIAYEVSRDSKEQDYSSEWTKNKTHVTFSLYHQFKTTKNMSTLTQPANDALSKGTNVYIAGFDMFKIEQDTNVHDMLVAFHKREYPGEPRDREWVISKFHPGDIRDAPDEVRRVDSVLCFGHLLYL